MRIIIFLLAIVSGFQLSFAQPALKATLLKNKFGYKTNDTITLLGYFPVNSSHNNKFVTKSKNGNLRLISRSSVRIIDSISNFWDNQWFLIRSGDIARRGWGMKYRNELKKASSSYLKDMKDNGFLLEDTALSNYLNNLVQLIHPQKLYKGYFTDLKVFVVKANEPDIFSFDNGSIFITTQMLSSFNTEEELINKLTLEISRIVGDHQFLSLRTHKNTQIIATALIITAAAITVAAIAANSKPEDTENHRHRHNEDYESVNIIVGSIFSYAPPKINFTPPSGYLKYSTEQINEAHKITSYYSSSELPQIEQLNPSDFIQTISPAITYTAWDLFFSSKYKESLSLINKIESADAAGSDDYLLKAKLYRKLYNTEESNYEALKYLQFAEEKNSKTNIDILRERGLIYYQLNNMPKAKSAFEEYRYGLQQTGITGDDDKKELNWINSMIEKTSQVSNK